MPGKGRGGKLTPVWTVVVVPAGTVAEADAAARRAQRLVAGWIQAGAAQAAAAVAAEAAAPVAAVAQPTGREC